MRAMILAAGLGTRLRPLTEQIPKPLVPVVGVPNIVRTIRHLKSSGVDRVIINLHHKPEPIRDLLADGSALGVEIKYSYEEQILGTGGGIKKALPLLGDEPFAVVNGDALFAPNLKGALELHERTGAKATLVVRPDPDAEKFGAVGLDKNSRIVSLVNSGDPKTAALLFMFTGVHIISPELGEKLPDDGCIVRKTYMPMVSAGENLLGFADDSFFCDLGTPERYIAANADLLCGNKTLRGFKKFFEGDLHVGSGVVMGEGCRLLGGTVIGDRVRIDPGITLDRVVVMEGAHVTENLKNAIVCSNGIVIRE